MDSICEMYYSDQSTAKFAKFYVPRNFMSRSFMPLKYLRKKKLKYNLLYVLPVHTLTSSRREKYTLCVVMWRVLQVAIAYPNQWV